MGLSRLKNLFANKSQEILNVYFTAGFPHLTSTAEIIEALSSNGADIIELGMPYSDPLADGLTIQQSSDRALKNGMNLKLLFDQIEEARTKSNIPIILMGYFNQILQFGVEEFLKLASNSGVDGLIVPDLPMNVYETEYRDLFDKYDLGMSFLIGPMTTADRIKKADRLSSGFIYMISQSSITGKQGTISPDQKAYFEKISSMNLNNPRLIGFGIHDQQTFQTACKYANGAIIGSAYIRLLANSENITKDTKEFIDKIRGNDH